MTQYFKTAKNKNNFFYSIPPPIKTKLHSRRVRKKKNLMSRIDRSQSSKHLAFHSRHMHQNKQCGTNLHKPIFRCLPNFPYQEANTSLTLYGITQYIPNKQKTIDHNSYVVGQWRRTWSTDSPHLLHIKHLLHTAICLFQRLSVVKILPKAAVQEKNTTLGGTLDCHTIFQGKSMTEEDLIKTE